MGKERLALEMEGQWRRIVDVALDEICAEIA